MDIVKDGEAYARFKLTSKTEQLSGFERQMEMDAQARRESDESQANALKDHVARLEKTLNAEIRRRVEANKALQGMFEAQMATVQDKLEAGLLDRLDQLHAAVGSLNERVDCVEKDFSLTREQYVRDIEDRSAMVAKDAASLQTAFVNERAERKERETLIVAKLRDLDARTAERIANEQADCDAKYEELYRELEIAVKDDEGDRRFQDYVLEEMAALKNGLVVESQMREQADDDIVNALNHYTKAIQEALRAVNHA